MVYEKNEEMALKYIDFKIINIKDVIGEVQTKYVEVNINNKIIFKDIKTGKYKYIDKKNNKIYESILDHVLCVHGKINRDNVMQIYEKDMTKELIEKDNEIKGMYIIKNNDLDVNIYELYNKKVEIIDNGWIITNKVPKIDIIKIGEYIEPEL